MTSEPKMALPMFVRPARPGEETFIADLQRDAMIRLIQEVHGPDQVTAVQEALNPAQMAAGWSAPIDAGVEDGRGVFVAEDAGFPAGFAALHTDPGFEGVEAGVVGPVAVAPGSAQILAFEVLPTHANKGHGSRLLAALADAARQAEVPGLAMWIVAEDSQKVDFFQKAGLSPVGLRRPLETPSGTITEHLWYADL